MQIILKITNRKIFKILKLDLQTTLIYLQIQRNITMPDLRVNFYGYCYIHLHSQGTVFLHVEDKLTALTSNLLVNYRAK